MIDRASFLHGALAATTVAPAVPFTQVLQQLTIGVSVPLSGPYAIWGREVLKGVQAAVDETNKYNATLNKAYGVRFFDDQNSGAIATSNVLVAAADPSIVGMVGNLTYDVTLTALQQYANAGFALVVPSVTNDKLTQQGYHNVFRLPANDTSEGQLFASAVLKGKASMNVLGVIVDGDYGLEVARAFVKQAQNDKHSAELLTLESNADVNDSTAIIGRHTPAYIFMAGKPEKLGPIALQLRNTGYTGQFGFADSFYTADVPKLYGKVLSGSLVASPMPPLDRVPSIVAYLQDFRNEVGAVTAFSAYGYAAAQLLIQASQRANITTRYQLLQQLQQGGTYSLLVGIYSFNYAGDASLPNVYLFALGADGFTFAKPAFSNGFVT
ncbi:MAG TPA: branched-chain amino acid ABC transporter substrate-binding protein [Candidatus Acidoferrales bacterium]|nr:branched-chain amino acid ABC transporter substrate-binding protein [Candidatus Acidoferrales bacterium]